MNEQPRRVQVEIGGRTYTLTGDRDVQAVKDVASFVDSRMAEIAAQTRTADTSRIAILTALNIADEFLNEKKGAGRPSSRSRSAAREKQFCRLLDEVLSG
ncbi:MAG: cell division protein ZapA [Acidobacteriota bacterium]